MNTTNHLHQSMGVLTKRLQACANEVEILKAKTSSGAGEQADKEPPLTRSDVELMVKEVIKKELTREKAILEASLNHKMDQQVSRALVSSDQSEAIMRLTTRIDALEEVSRPTAGVVAEEPEAYNGAL